jgi:DNA primase
MDRFEDVRRIPLRDVLMSFGYCNFKKRAGKAEWYGGCPFHDAKKNKTSFSFTAEKFNCFSCGEHGAGAIDLVMKLKKIGFQEAVEVLGALVIAPQAIQTKSQREPNLEVTVSANKPFEGKYEKFYVPSDWLKARGFSEETLKLYGVGQYFNPARKSAYSNKVLFPILRFADGVKTGYLSRTIEQESSDPKYAFPSGFHKSLELFGSWQLRQSLSGQAQRLRLGFVVESPLCVMKLHQLGFPAVSPFGAFLSSEQVEMVAALFVGVVYLPDRDKYDQIAATCRALASRTWLKAPELPESISDPEHLNREQLLQLMKAVAN